MEMEKITQEYHMLSICYHTGVSTIKIRGVTSLSDMALIDHHNLNKKSSDDKVMHAELKKKDSILLPINKSPKEKCNIRCHCLVCQIHRLQAE